MTAAAYDLAGPLPSGVTVLEASAGTGKTYVLAGLVTRYVASGVRLPNLLVVTFTRAATAELRERVRQRLVGAAEHLGRVLDGTAAATDDVVLKVLASGDRTQLHTRLSHLATALTEFDAATIATIHGFCQQVLYGIGLAGDVDRNATLVDNLTELVEAAVDDLCVRRFAAAQPGQAMVKRAALLSIARTVIANPDARLFPPTADAPDGVLRTDLAGALRVEVDRRKRAAGLLSYDDLLTRLAATLDDPRHGPPAVARLRHQYRVALVDEFQDTDPVQWAILSRAFAGAPGPLVLIGDPKQAIYTFRGADVYAYLHAAETAAGKATLQENWRSDAALLDALNVLFRGARLGDARIAYLPVRAAPPHREARLVGVAQPAPVRLRVLRRDAQVRLVGKHPFRIQAGSAREYIARDVAAQAVQLLSSPAKVIARRPDGTEQNLEALAPRHLAVLVRTNAEASLIQRTLREAGVPAVINGVGSVFATPAATAWLRLLQALERPAETSRARTAALTPFLGWSAEQLAGDDEDALEEVFQRLHRWAGVLRERGVGALLSTVTLEEKLPQRVLARPQGERFLTDLQHLGELLHIAATVEEVGSAALGAWLRERIAQSADDDGSGGDEQARRLESDAEAVQVLTVHRSKGLEFPVVLCPFLWSPGRTEAVVPVFHDGDAGARQVDVNGAGEEYRAHQEQARREQKGEQLRLLYVALTRARHQVLLWWAPVSKSDESPLARLLFCRQGHGPVNTACQKAQVPDDDLTLDRLGALAADALGAIAVEVASAQAPSAAWPGLPVNREPLRAATFDRSIDHRWRRTSYSALTALSHAQPMASEPEERLTDDEPAVATTATTLDGSQDGLRARPAPLADLPGGTEVGTLVHAVLEQVDFDAADLHARLAEQVVAQRVRRHVAIGDPDLLVNGLHRALATPLGPLAADRRLCDVARHDRLDELTFELRLAGSQGDAEVTVAVIGDLLRAHLAPEDALAGYAERLAQPELRRDLRGYLTGSIDLVLRLPGGRYALVDYKTNRLAGPGEPLTLWHYRPVALADAMQRSHYPLQALLYSVALHRFLRWRLGGSYDPVTNLGGVLYLFIRGMAGADTPRVDGVPTGVFSWLPPPALVVALSDLLDGRGAR